MALYLIKYTIFYFILFYSILFYFILFYFMLCYFILFYFILFYFILTCADILSQGPALKMPVINVNCSCLLKNIQ